MHCFDCAEQNVERLAVGVCIDCGAGVCAEHAHAVRHHATCRMTHGMAAVQLPARTTARILRCPSCTEVRTTVAACEGRGGRDC